jgi:hypothetical protein
MNPPLFVLINDNWISHGQVFGDFDENSVAVLVAEIRNDLRIDFSGHPEYSIRSFGIKIDFLSILPGKFTASSTNLSAPIQRNRHFHKIPRRSQQHQSYRSQNQLQKSRHNNSPNRALAKDTRKWQAETLGDIGKKRNVAVILNRDFRRRSNGLIEAKTARMQFLIPGDWMEHQGWQNQPIASRNEIRRKISQREIFADAPIYYLYSPRYALRM